MSHQRKSKIVTPKDNWGTPDWLFDLLDREFHFCVDAAALIKNAKCNHYYDPLNDALCGNWYENAKTLSIEPTFYLNPPYSAGNIDKFMAKALEESQKGAVVVCLVPCATDTKWWHKYAMKAQEIRFIKGRVRFVGFDEEGKQVKNSPTFSSCVVIFNRNVPEGYTRILWDLPRIGKTIEQPNKEKTV
jgi:phage N-6-adenine-methyltransferase